MFKLFKLILYGWGAILLIGVFFFLLLFFFGDRRTPEEQVKLFNTQYAPEARIDLHGNLFLNLSSQNRTRFSAPKDQINLLIPKDFEPKLETYGSHRSRTVYIKVTLDELSDWSKPPPIPQEIANNVWLYSSLRMLIGMKPNTVEDPKVRDSIYEFMKSKRRVKLVEYGLDAKLYENYTEWRRSIFYPSGYTGYDPDVSKDRSYRQYIPDGYIDTLERYSFMHCYSRDSLKSDPYNPADTRWKIRKSNLEKKPQDDHSPDNCFLNRVHSKFINKASENRDNWVGIDCSPVSHECTAYFIAGRRSIEVTLWYHDIPQWRNTIEPIRLIINNFVIKNPKNIVK